jgi:hypothetical protein
MAFQMAVTQMVTQQLSQLLTQVCQDYHLDAAEVIPRYLEGSVAPVKPKAPRQPKAPKAPKEDRPLCAGMVKGCPCKHKAQVGDDLCHIHKRQRDNPKADKAPKRICCGTTSKGVPCTVKAQEGSELCHLHMARQPREVQKPIRKKAVAPQVAGRGESPPAVFCQPCAPTPPSEGVEAEVDLDDQMEDLQRRLASIMVGAGPSKEALESEGLDEDPEEFDASQMDSPHSHQRMERMMAFDAEMSEEFLDE